MNPKPSPGTDPYATQFEVIPLRPSKLPTTPELHHCLLAAKNKGQMLRCTLRFLSSRGMLSDMPTELWNKLAEYLHDYKEVPKNPKK